MPAPDNINTLGSTASFYEWFESYNSEVIGKLNKMYVYQIFAGSGIGVTGDGAGGYTLSIGNIIASGITFTGTAAFSGNVSFSSANVLLENISKKFIGDYTTIGVTLGSVVRVTTTGGLTLSKSTSREDAEAIGVVTSSNTTESVVAVAGKISGKTLTDSIINGGGVFSTGCVYFLSSNSGKITTTEPTSHGTVSKPILVATSVYEGIILPYRGQYIDLVGASGASADFDNLIVPILSESGETAGNFKLSPGNVMAFSASEVAGFTLYRSNIDSINYVKYKPGNATITSKNILGIVSGFASGATYSTVNPNYMIVEPFGSVTDFDSLNWPESLRNIGFIYFDGSGNPTNTNSTTALMGIAVNNNFIFLPQLDTTSLNDKPTGNNGGGDSNKTKNLLTNGSLSIWQRKDKGDQLGGWTSSGTGGYFADRWVIINTNPTGQTFTVRRDDFSPMQTDVDGFPDHYVNIKGTTKGSGNTFYVENRTQDPRTHSGKDVTFSFYTKNNTGTGITLSPYVKQYGSTYTNPIITTFPDLYITSSSWQRNISTFTIPPIDPNTIGITLDSEGFVGIGIQVKSPTIDVDFAQFILEEGKTAGVPDMIDIDEEYKKCSYYYQRSYSPKTPSGTSTYSSSPTAKPGATSTYSSGKQSLGGAITITPNKNNDLVHSYKLPNRMRKSDYFKVNTQEDTAADLVKSVPVKIYSPSSIIHSGGAEDNALNITANNNINKTQGTLADQYTDIASKLGLSTPSVDKIRRTYTSTLPTIKAAAVADYDGYVTDISVELVQGFQPLDRIAFHYTIDLDLYQGLV